jgi:hypothetical protein
MNAMSRPGHLPTGRSCYLEKQSARSLARAGAPVDVPRKPSSVPHRGRPRRGSDHSSRTAVAGRLEQPTRRLGRVTLSGLPKEAGRLPMWPCSRWGLPCRPRCRVRGGLLPRRFTLTCRGCPEEQAGQAVCFLWHSPRRFRHRALPGIALCGARTFLPPRRPLGSARSGRRPLARRRHRLP